MQGKKAIKALLFGVIAVSFAKTALQTAKSAAVICAAANAVKKI